MTFDEKVALLRGKVVPKVSWANGRQKTKAECTPEEWAARLDWKQQNRKKNRTKLNQQRREQRARNRETVRRENASERTKQRKAKWAAEQKLKKKNLIESAFHQDMGEVVRRFIEGRGPVTKGLTKHELALLGKHCPLVLRIWEYIRIFERSDRRRNLTLRSLEEPGNFKDQAVNTEFLAIKDHVIKQFLEGRGPKEKGITNLHVQLLNEHYPKVLRVWEYIKKFEKRDSVRQSYRKHAEKRRRYSQRYRQENKDKVNDLNRRYYKSSTQHKLRVALRNRLNLALRRQLGKSEGRKISALECGCSVADLAAHLETMFEPGMTWENWASGNAGWHLDHIYPLSAADLNDERQLRAVCHYRNLRPMWGLENLEKNAKITPEAERLFSELLTMFGD